MEERRPAQLERRCRATGRSGDRCRAVIVNANGYCVAHDPDKPMDMRELGRKSGEARRRPNPERIHEGLRAYLQREVPPERVWRALEAAMLGSNEAARVSASKVLIDALSEGRGACAACAAREAVDMTAARAKLDRVIEGQVEQRAEEITKDLQQRTKEVEGQLEALRAEHALA